MTPDSQTNQRAQIASMLLAHALDHHGQGRTGDAAALYRQLLALDPAQPKALLGLGVIAGQEGNAALSGVLLARYLEQAPRDVEALMLLGGLRQTIGDDQEAVALFGRAVELAPQIPSAHLGLGVSFHRLGRLDLAERALAQALRLAPNSADIHNGFGDLRFTQTRYEDALGAFDRALAVSPDHAIVQCNRGITLIRLERFEEAVAALVRAIEIVPDYIEARLNIADALDVLGRAVEATSHREHVMACQHGMVEPCSTGHPDARILVVGAGLRCDVPVKFLLPRRHYDRATVLVVGREPIAAGAPSLGERLPPVDIVFNAIADADHGSRYLDDAARFCDRLGLPVLNPPERVSETKRDRVGRLLAGIPDLVVPATRRVTANGLRAFARDHDFDRALIIRPVGSHAGIGLEKIDGAGAIDGYLARVRADEYYVTDYHDYRSADGQFRKYRLIFVDREVYPYHLGIMDHWMVHYWRADMNAAPWMKDEEEAFLADYTSVFDGPRGAAVRAIAQAIDLDYAGLDCGLLPDGRVLFFEANANMWIHLNDPVDTFGYKHRHVPRIFEAMRTMVAARIG